MEKHEQADEEAEGAPQVWARGCGDCDWYRTQINRAAGCPQPRADLETLYGAHLRREHAPGEQGLRGV